MDVKESLKNIPSTPGVYLFYDNKDKVIYIGKAASLSKRISSYFHKRYRDSRIESMISNIRKIEYIPTASSAEALIYEASLIKENKPRYNVALKDDKSYPYLKLTTKEAYPRLSITRQIKKDGSLYYGPYTNVKLLRQALSMMKRIFPLRTCNKIPKKPCLNLHLDQCLGPCINKNINSFYKNTVEDIKLFLKGKKKALIKRLSKRMQDFSKNLQYEKALKIKKQIDALSVVIDQGKPLFPIKKDLIELKEILHLRHIPARIEAFDISNIHGYGAVGSMVTFFNAKPLKAHYRRFRIKTVTDIDDYAMIKEIVRRRYMRLLKEKKNFPDLILIDGGKGHLKIASNELKSLGLKIPVISIAKKTERIFTENRSSIIIPRRSNALKLMQRIRDEAHRFAISYHRILRKKILFK